MHEKQLREVLAVKAVEDREAGTSARESRAASAMMVVREENRLPSEGTVPVCELMCVHIIYMYVYSSVPVTLSLEEHIVQACLLENLVPSPSFQLAVSQVHVYT